MKFSFKSKKGKSEQLPKTEDCFLLHSYICGFSEALSGNVSPQFPWNSSTACLAWRKNYIFVNISSIPEKGKEFKGTKDRPSLSEPGQSHRIFRFVSGYIPFNDVKFVWITCSGVKHLPYVYYIIHKAKNPHCIHIFANNIFVMVCHGYKKRQQLWQFQNLNNPSWDLRLIEHNL